MNDHDTDVSLEPAELPNLTADPLLLAGDGTST